MDAITVTAAASAMTCAASTVATAWIRSRSQLQRVREEARRDHVHGLPPGSRVIDLGGRGIVIEVGGQGAWNATNDGNETSRPVRTRHRPWAGWPA
jgi:hypothetical protein